MLDMPELGADPKYSATIGRFNHADELKAIITPALLKKTALEWFEMGIELRLPLAVVPDMKELLEQDVHRARGAFGTVEIGNASFEGPVLPQYLTRSAQAERTRAACRQRRQSRPSRTHAQGDTRSNTEGCAAAERLRIVDLTMGWAGPTATRQMGDLGADIIKVESCQYPDWFRGTDTRPPYHEERTYEKTYWFQMNNRNKRGITLDLTTEAGLAAQAADEGRRCGNRQLRRRRDAAPRPRRRRHSEDQSASDRGDHARVRHDGKMERRARYGSTLEQASGLPSVTGGRTIRR
jgi:crotonobetainyl-CoA:carnitine CoA-transferase CaiB-like acyl-CoA transferase